MKYPLLIASIMSLMITSCSSHVEESSKKSQYSEYEIVNDRQIKWSDVLSQEDEGYVVFFYSETCNHCHEMMEDVIAFASENIEPTYFLDTALNPVVIKPLEEIEIGVDDIKDFAIRGTPTLVEVSKGVVTAHVGGLDPCLTFMNEKRMQKD